MAGDVDFVAIAGLHTATHIESRAIWRNRRSMIYVRYYHQRLYSQELALPQRQITQIACSTTEYVPGVRVARRSADNSIIG